MDDATRAKAIEKNLAMARRIGYPDYVKNDTYLNEMYKNTTITSDAFFANTVALKMRDFIADAKIYGRPVDSSRWGDPPQTVNAYYSPNYNHITFPSGIIKAPFFDLNYPNYLNYGGLGVVIGHEITHGFDDQGRMYDKDGKVANWWSDATAKSFVDKAQCIVDQYGNFSKVIDGKQVFLNGVTMQGEAIADNGGIGTAYRAYKDFEAQNGKEKLLPGLNYTQDQLFLLNFAQVWCGLERDEHFLELVKSDPHPPHQFRVAGGMKNMKEFGSIFQCAAGTPMNP